MDIRRILYGIKDEDRERTQKEALMLTADDIRRAAQAFSERLRRREYSIAVIGDRKAVEESSYDFETQSLPVK